MCASSGLWLHFILFLLGKRNDSEFSPVPCRFCSAPNFSTAERMRRSRSRLAHERRNQKTEERVTAILSRQTLTLQLREFNGREHQKHVPTNATRSKFLSVFHHRPRFQSAIQCARSPRVS
ncbi:hypothetical protein BU23DRAFT_18438 [Bimuria novae-zelandiae CBS 107.79]|uniref:BZIP domain-containing protein n=1 Tax=Bimuria novae-zelandiae CBS 107.79 TaxID=1447943 RepID=A0A6A5UMV0_9PLEO|nr:hypothetical protein BU23DRAFT_18438 [Bimuria novae-zelandiae CBS 107.79]